MSAILSGAPAAGRRASIGSSALSGGAPSEPTPPAPARAGRRGSITTTPAFTANLASKKVWDVRTDDEDSTAERGGDGPMSPYTAGRMAAMSKRPAAGGFAPNSPAVPPAPPPRAPPISVHLEDHDGRSPRDSGVGSASPRNGADGSGRRGLRGMISAISSSFRKAGTSGGGGGGGGGGGRDSTVYGASAPSRGLAKSKRRNTLGQLVDGDADSDAYTVDERTSEGDESDRGDSSRDGGRRGRSAPRPGINPAYAAGGYGRARA
jgi:hypothetical protein